MLGTLGHVGEGTGDFEPFDQRYKDSLLVTPADIKNGAPIDALVVWGGEDISPSLYRSSVSPFCGATATQSRRDKLEASAMLACIGLGIPIIGVCRGAQLACALSGGKLIQHVTGHAGTHPITTDDGRELLTSSVHHQMMYPWDVKDGFKVVAWSSNRRSSRYETGEGEEAISEHAGEMVEPEIVWFERTKSLAIQGHPEFMQPGCEFVRYVMGLVDRFIEPVTLSKRTNATTE